MIPGRIQMERFIPVEIFQKMSYLPNFLFQNMQDIDLSTDSLGSGMELSSAVDNILPLEDGSPQLV